MVYLELFLGFLKVGCFSFGGGYGAVPLIRDVVLSHGWLSEENLTYMIAVSESTPGPIMVNMATYIGSAHGGFPGALIATAAVVMPSFLIILLITALLKTALKSPTVQAVLGGLKPCVVGIVLATGMFMVLQNCMDSVAGGKVSPQAIFVAVFLVIVKLVYQRFAGKKLSPILLILLSAVAGIIVYGL